VPAAVIPIDARPSSALRQGVWSLIEAMPPGHAPLPLGILLAGENPGEFGLTFLPSADLPQDLNEEEADVLALLAEDLTMKANEQGAEVLLASLEDSLSHFLRISDRTAIAYSGSAQAAADRLFSQHIDSRVRKYETHLPLYSLRAAATKFGEGMEVSASDDEWIRVAHLLPRLRLTDNMFVAHVVGRSMEPLIPDGSLCVFRYLAPGSRVGKRVLVEKLGETDFSARYTVKRYTRVGPAVGAGGLREGRIRLEPINPEFEAFDLEGSEFESNYRVIAEFIEVLPN